MLPGQHVSLGYQRGSRSCHSQALSHSRSEVSDMTDSQTRCGVLPGFFGLLVQGVLFSVGVLTLFLKYYAHERKKKYDQKRSCARFVFDSSKQITGSLLIHFMNLYLSVDLQGDHTDECSWYWIEIMVDTTIGVGVEAAVNELVEMAVKRSGQGRERLQLLKTSCVDADYTNNNTWIKKCKLPITSVGDVYFAVYLFQLAHWLLIVIIMKFFMLLFMLSFKKPLVKAASTVLSSLQSRPNVKLVFVMVFTPTVMNAVQYWLQDEIIVRISKSTKKSSEAEAPLHGGASGSGLAEGGSRLNI